MIFGPASSILTAGAETAALLDRRASERGMFARAKERALELERPLVVCKFTRGERCGDLPCVSIRGCKRCGASARDLCHPGAIDVEDGGAVVLVLFALEHVDDIDMAWRELLRAAGTTSAIFVVSVQRWAKLTSIATGCRYEVTSAPPQSLSERLGYRKLVREPRAILGGRKRSR